LYLCFQVAEAQSIVDLASGDVDRGINSAARTAGTGASARFAVAEQDVANLVTGERTHPAPVSIRSIRTLLEDSESRRSNHLDRGRDLHPPRSDVATRSGHVEIHKPVLRGGRLGRGREDVGQGLVLPI